MKDILVFTPVLRLEPETVRSVFALEWNGAVSFLMQRDNPTGNPFRDHLHQYKRGREAFLAGSYDGMMIVENDMILPADALERLNALDCDLAYGCYLHRDGRVVNVLERYQDWPEMAANPGESLTIRNLWSAAQAKGIVDCSGGGLGCVLIRRGVIEAMPWALPFAMPSGMPFEGTMPETIPAELSLDHYFDYDWTCAVYRAGYRMMADCQVLCGHIDRDGKEIWIR